MGSFPELKRVITKKVSLSGGAPMSRPLYGVPLRDETTVTQR